MENNEEWFIEVKSHDDYVFEATLKNNDGEIYDDAVYVVDLSDDDVITAQAFGYFRKDWDLKLEAIELIKLYIQEM